MKRFEPRVGDLVRISVPNVAESSYAFVAIEREAGFLYDVFLVHEIEDMAGPMDLVVDENLTDADFRLVVQFDSMVSVLAEHIAPSPWSLRMNIFDAARLAYRGMVVNEENVWTGLPFRGQLDQRLEFKQEQSALGDLLSSSAIEIAGLAMVIDPRLADVSHREAFKISLVDLRECVLHAPQRAYNPDSAILFERARVASSDHNELTRELSDLLATACVNTPSRWKRHESDAISVVTASGIRTTTRALVGQG